eukprot:m.22671 g.22671  ORF g.22671 m.22671 type:complete len:337 (-) comp13900_c0_seq1:43-1053(-)
MLVSRVGGCLRQCVQCSKAPMRLYSTGVPQVFDRRAKRRQRDKAARDPGFQSYERLRNEVAWQMCDRVQDISRPFDLGLDLGCGRGHLGQQIDDEMIKYLVQSELASGPLNRFDESCRDAGMRIQSDEEVLPFRRNTFDVVLSNLSLHWVNDLPGCLTQINNSLVPDGVFIGSMFGGETLYELRCSMQLADIERKGGFAPRISPFVEVKDCGSLLQRTGFTLLTVDVDEFTINYPSPFELLEDLQGMGESNAAIKRPPFLSKESIAATAAIYQEMYGNDDGTIPATFQVIYLLGWKPDKSQVTPARRGSATHSIKELGIDLETLQQSISSGDSNIK